MYVTRRISLNNVSWKLRGRLYKTAHEVRGQEARGQKLGVRGGITKIMHRLFFIIATLVFHIAVSHCSFAESVYM